MFGMSIFQFIYLILFIASIFCFIILFNLKKRNNGYYVALFACVLIENFGYFKLSCSKTVDSAILSNEIVYLGGVTIPLFCIFCIADLCNEKRNKVVGIIISIISMFLIFLTNTLGKSSLYYKSVDLEIVNGFSRLVKEYGPLHIVYPIYLFLVIVICFGIIIKAYKNKRQVSYITSTFLCVNMSFIVIIYFLERLLNIPVELLPLSFLILQISVLILLNRINNYDTLSVSSSSIKDSEKFGFVIFNSNGRLFGSDNVSRLWFSELNNLSIDRVIKKDDTDFLSLIQKWIKNPDVNEIKYFERNDKIIEARLSIIEKKGRYSVFCVNLRDDTEQQKLTNYIKSYNEKLELIVKEKVAQLEKVQNDIIMSMADTVESRDFSTGGHIRRTCDVVKIFVEHLISTKNFPIITEHFSKCIIKSASLHDFGKIGIPDYILTKQGKFTDEEYEIMKTHSANGAVIVSNILKNSDDSQFREIAVNVAHYHHEKWNGFGYPEKLKGEEIPFEARIMALADVFDALVSKRCYKEKFSYDKAFSIIEESCGTHFDPKLCVEFLKCRTQLEKLFDSYE